MARFDLDVWNLPRVEALEPIGIWGEGGNKVACVGIKWQEAKGHAAVEWRTFGAEGPTPNHNLNRSWVTLLRTWQLRVV